MDGEQSMEIAVNIAEAVKKRSLETQADCLGTAWACICHVLVAYLVFIDWRTVPS